RNKVALQNLVAHRLETLLRDALPLLPAAAKPLISLRTLRELADLLEQNLWRHLRQELRVSPRLCSVPRGTTRWPSECSRKILAWPPLAKSVQGRLMGLTSTDLGTPTRFRGSLAGNAFGPHLNKLLTRAPSCGLLPKRGLSDVAPAAMVHAL